MHKVIAISLLTVCTLATYAQDQTVIELKALTDKKEFDKIIAQYASKFKELSARSLYYVGHAYYIKEDDNNCIKFMDLSIAKDPKDPAPYYIKASTLNYLGKFQEAITLFNAAINLNPAETEFYSGLGDSYFNLKKYDPALAAYKKATAQLKHLDRPYSMIAQIYSNLNETDKALEAFYIAKSKISKQSDSYLNTLFNIGLLESLKGNYEKAEPHFVELIQINPADYHSYAKLIQIYYHRKEYDKAMPLKEKLYEASKKGQLEGNLKDMFCIDQFKWKDKTVQVYERYEEGNKSKIYFKHLFYVVNNNGEIEFRAQTEFSPISVELGGPKYVLCANKGTTHFNSGLAFNDDFKYEDLKAAAIWMIEKYVK